MYCVKSVHIPSYSGPHFPAFGLDKKIFRLHLISPYSVQMPENTDQKNSEYEPYLHSDG